MVGYLREFQCICVEKLLLHLFCFGVRGKPYWMSGVASSVLICPSLGHVWEHVLVGPLLTVVFSGGWYLGFSGLGCCLV